MFKLNISQKHHSENQSLDRVTETQAQVDELKGIMVRNIGMFPWCGFTHRNTNNLHSTNTITVA